MEPLDLRRESQSLKYWARVKSRPCNPVNDILGTCNFVRARYKKPKLPFGSYVQTLAEEYNVEDISPADSRPRLDAPWILSNPKVDISLSSKFQKCEPAPHILNITKNHINSSYAEHLQIFTDGSKDENKSVSAAMVIPSLNISTAKRLSNNLSIYTAELTAINYALNWTLLNRPHKVAILSDSLSALQSIKSKSSNSRPDIIENTISLQDQCQQNDIQVNLVWCPAHVNLEGNELADGAAKNALRSLVCEKVPLAKTEMYSLIKCKMSHKWTERLLTLPKGQPLPVSGSSLRPPTDYSYSYKLDKCVTRLRLGYSLLPGSLGQHILGISPNCPKCDVRLTAEHFLMDCGVHRVARNKLKNALGGAGLMFTLHEVLFPSRANQKSVFSALASYLLDCEMSDKI